MAAQLNNMKITILATVFIAVANAIEKFPLLMPNVRPTQPETYLCTPVRIDPGRDYYIVSFEPNATMAVAHHMLLYGCTTPGSDQPVWNCGEMAASSENELTKASPCGTGSQIIYAWARDAPPLQLPNGVGFKIGGSTTIQYLVLQVHYGHVDHFKDGSTDDSGVFLAYTEIPQPKQAGVILLGTGGYIQPNSIEYMETACEIQEDKVLHPFAFRTHTHSLGRLVAGYRVRRDDDDVDHWTLLGKRDPMLPQMFYPAHTNETIQQGDVLAARCTMVSDRNRITYIGATNEDEMCNFYLMYYVDNDEPLHKKYCFSAGPPAFEWKQFPLNHIPDEEASSI